MKSALRICFGVLVGVGFFVGLALVGKYYPAATRRIWSVVMGLGFGGLMAWLVVHDLRTGVAQGKFARYERSEKPFHFWFYIAFYILLSAVFLMLGVWCIVSPSTSPLR